MQIIHHQNVFRVANIPFSSIKMVVPHQCVFKGEKNVTHVKRARMHSRRDSISEMAYTKGMGLMNKLRVQTGGGLEVEARGGLIWVSSQLSEWMGRGDCLYNKRPISKEWVTRNEWCLVHVFIKGRLTRQPIVLLLISTYIYNQRFT